MKKYIVYIDDTGTKDLSDKNTNYFSYCGIITEIINVKNIIKKIKLIKKKYLNESIELKSRWFRMPELKNEKYLIPFNLSNEKFTEFSTNLFNIICSLSINCLGVVLDKKKLEKTYKNPFNPSSICYELLIQHIANYLTQHNGKLVKIVIDDMNGKTQKGNDWKNLLIRQHQNLKLGNSPLYKYWEIRTKMDYSKIPDKIIFRNSEISNMLQITDLCTYNIMRQGKDNWNNFDNEPYYEGYKWIKKIMHKSPRSGKITKYGACCFPE